MASQKSKLSLPITANYPRHFYLFTEFFMDALEMFRQTRREWSISFRRRAIRTTFATKIEKPANTISLIENLYFGGTRVKDTLSTVPFSKLRRNNGRLREKQLNKIERRILYLSLPRSLALSLIDGSMRSRYRTQGEAQGKRKPLT